jgi:hypothetical protein
MGERQNDMRERDEAIPILHQDRLARAIGLLQPLSPHPKAVGVNVAVQERV